MELKKQVCSLELAKKLKELGVKEESLFAYYGNAGNWHDTIVDMGMYKDVDDDFREYKLLPAYTVAELIEILGEDFRWLKKRGHNENTVWLAQARIHPITSKDIKVTAKTPQEALAKLLIYLLENNLLKLK